MRKEEVMPPVEKHTEKSFEMTGKEFREVHEWLDGDPERKAERHDITKVFEYGAMIEDKWGTEGREEYVRHLHDDIKAKFDHLQHDLEKTIAETLAYFGVK